MQCRRTKKSSLNTKNSMQQPCVDKYGNDICKLRRFDRLPPSEPGTRMSSVGQDKQNTLQKEMSGTFSSEVQKILQKVSSQMPTSSSEPDEKSNPTGQSSNYRQPVPSLRPNTQTLTVEERMKAQMIRVGRTAYRKGFPAAQSEIDSGPLRGWTIDTELSSAEGLVLTKGREIRVAYRGTDFTNLNDLVTDAAAAAGYERFAPQMIQSRLQIEAIEAKYGRLPTELLGYSKGGAHAMAMGDRFGIPSTSYNPLVGRKQLMSKSEVPHTIIRTVEDPVSTTLALARGKKNYTVKAIDPIRGLGDPKDAHELTHFTSAGPRQPGGIDALMMDGVRKGQQLAHLETLDAMKTGVEQGKTFTQALDDFNRSNGTAQRVDVLEDGSLGPRIHRESGTVKYWKDSGGTLTAEEEAHLNANPPPPPRELSDEARAMGLGEELTDAQRRYVTSLSTSERTEYMKEQRTSLQQNTELINESVLPHQTVLKALIPRTTTLATGAVAGVVAHATMNAIDPNHRMNRVAEEATEGAIAGGIGVGAASAVGASAALGPEVLAGASAYIAGSESGRAITSAMERAGVSRGTAEAVGGVSGGAIGGATASAVASGATIAGSMAFGAEAGEALGVVGGPIGMVAGALGGTVIGAAIGGIGYLFSHPLFGGSHQHSTPTPAEPTAVQAQRAYAPVQQTEQLTPNAYVLPGL